MDENDQGSGSAHQGASGVPNDWENNIQWDDLENVDPIPQDFDWKTYDEEIDAEDVAKMEHLEEAAKSEQLGHQGPDDLENDNQLEELLRNSAPIPQDLGFDTTFYDEIVAEVEPLERVESLEATRIEKPTG